MYNRVTEEIDTMDQRSIKGRTFSATERVRSKGSSTAPTVRTFRADVEELIQKKGTTKTQIIMAEAEEKGKRGEHRVLHKQENSHFGRIIFLLSLILAFALGICVHSSEQISPFHSSTKRLSVKKTDHHRYG